MFSKQDESLDGGCFSVQHGYMKKTTKERFWERVGKRGPDDCWEWLGSIDSTGYGRFSLLPKEQKAHRFMWSLDNGEIPSGHNIYQTCRNRKCVNPSHLLATKHQLNKTIKDRFLEKFDMGDDDECWNWTGCINGGGYGTIKVDGYAHLANRLSWIIHNGDIPDGKMVLHRCDNRKCVRPGHLFLGTNQDNMDDMVRKGRQRTLCGEEHYYSKLTEEKVIEIRKIHKSKKVKVRDIAARYGVSYGCLQSIIYGYSWRHLL